MEKTDLLRAIFHAHAFKTVRVLKKQLGEPFVNRICNLIGIEEGKKRFLLLDCKFRAIDSYKAKYSKSNKSENSILGKRSNQDTTSTETADDNASILRKISKVLDRFEKDPESFCFTPHLEDI